MANIIDYIHWRGDLTFRQSPFNKIDSLILSCLAYLPFDHLYNEKSLTIKQLGSLFFQSHSNNSPDIVLPLSVELLKAMMHSKRFGKLITEHYVNIIDIKKELQFSALCIHLDKQTTYVAYRGTDNTLVGWKEDFNMAFAASVPAQTHARDYLIKHRHNLRSHIILGGHSKGGNLAIFAAIFAPKTIRDRIIQIYNFDGPGFSSHKVLTHKQYELLANKIHTFVPETAIVGMLMTHKTPYTVVKSQGKEFLQHDPFNWHIQQTNFEYVDTVDVFSQRIQNASNALLNKLDISERQHLVDSLFSILSATKIKNVKHLGQLPLKLNDVIKHYHTLSVADKKLIMSSLSLLIKTFHQKH